MTTADALTFLACLGASTALLVLLWSLAAAHRVPGPYPR